MTDNAIAKKPVDAVGFIINPQNLEEALKVCNLLAKSDMVPKDYKGKPENILVAINMGLEVGLKPLQALQNIAVINGKPAMWGDAVVAIVRGSGTCEYLHEIWDEKTQTAICRGRRKGETEDIVRSFSFADAEKAGLIARSKDKGYGPGTWLTYPKRMAGWRAKSWVLRDGWADHLKGISIREEVEDIPTEPKETVALEDPKPLAIEHVVETQTVQPQPEPKETAPEGEKTVPTESQPEKAPESNQERESGEDFAEATVKVERITQKKVILDGQSKIRFVIQGINTANKKIAIFITDDEEIAKKAKETIGKSDITFLFEATEEGSYICGIN